MKIGFNKPTTLNNGFVGDFWRIGTVIAPYNENLPTDLGREIEIRVQFYLYQDFAAYVNNLLSASTVWVDTSLSYSKVKENVFDNIMDKVASTMDNPFYGCEIVSVPL